MQNSAEKTKSFRLSANSPWFLPVITIAVLFELLISEGRIAFLSLTVGFSIAFLWCSSHKNKVVFTGLAILIGAWIYHFFNFSGESHIYYFLEYPIFLFVISITGYLVISPKKNKELEFPALPDSGLFFFRLVPLTVLMVFLYGYFRYPTELNYIENRLLNSFFLLAGIATGLFSGLYAIIGISGRKHERSKQKKLKELIVFASLLIIYLIIERLLSTYQTIVLYIIISIPLFIWVLSNYGIRQASFLLLQIAVSGSLSFQLSFYDISSPFEFWTICSFQLFIVLLVGVFFFSSISQYELRYFKENLEYERKKMNLQIESSTQQLKMQVNDINVTKQALKESEDRYHKLSSVTNEGIAIHDKGIALDVNDSFLNISGYQRHEIIGKNLLRLIVREKEEVDQIAFNLEKNSDEKYELLATRRDGSVIPVEVFAKSVSYKGDMLRVISVKDISARVEAEKQLNILQAAIQQSPGSILITDPKGNVEYINPAFTEITGYTPEDVLGRNPRILKSGHHSASFYKDLWKTITNGKTWSGEFLNRKKNGDIYWEDAVIGPIFGLNNEISHFICTKAEITIQKKAQESLKSSEQQFRNLAENAPVYIMKVNKQGEVTYLNQPLSHQDASLEIKKKVFDYIDSENHDLLRSTINRVFENKVIESCELTAEGIDHKKLYYQARLSPLIVDGNIDNIILILQDVTLSFESKLRIAESEKRYKLLADNIIDIIWALNKDNQYVFVSPSVIDVLGYSSEEVLNSVIGEKLPPIPDSLIQRLHDADLSDMHNAEEVKWEYSQRCKSGEEKWLETNIKPLYSEKGNFDGIVGVSRDITGRKRSELVLRENEEVLRGFIEESQAMIIVLDKDTGIVIEANKSACKFYGLSEEEFQNLSIYDISEDDDEITTELLKKAVAGNQKMFNTIHKVKNKQLKDVELFPTLISSQNKKYLFTIIQDVTQRRKAVNALRESESKKLALLKIIPDLILVISDDGVFKDVYTDDPSQLVVEPQRIIGQKFSQILPPDLSYKLTLLIDDAFETRDIQSFDYKYKTGKGRPVYEEIRVIVSGRKEVLVIIRDITNQKYGEIELKKAWKEAKEANRLKGVFLANISHEIRTPINSIIGFSELLDKELIEPMQKSYVDSVKSSSKTLLSLIDDLLDLSKIEAGKMSMRKDEVNIRLLVEDITRLFSIKVKEKNLVLKVNVERNVPDIIVVDELRLRQILMNLLGNAIKFTEKGYVSLNIIFQSKKKNSDMLILVEDSGIGISDKDLERVFQAFTQQDDQDSKKFGGTGLGLTITKRLVELMNGKIHAESKANEGTKFTIHLRNIESRIKTKTLKFDSSSADQKRVVFCDAKILVVDDVPLNRELLMNFLSKSEVELFEAEDGQQAVDIVRKEKPDCILMDIRMPVLNGLEASKIIKQDVNLKHIKIIGISATPIKEFAEREYLDEFIHKPVKLKELSDVLQKYIPVKEDDKDKIDSETGLPEELLKDVVKVDKQLLKLNESYKKVQISSSFEDYESFADELMVFAQGYELSKFKSLANAIKVSVRTFDLGGIMHHLSGFDHLVNDLNSKLELTRQK